MQVMINFWLFHSTWVNQFQKQVVTIEKVLKSITQQDIPLCLDTRQLLG
jgi:hypothetical protein